MDRAEKSELFNEARELKKCGEFEMAISVLGRILNYDRYDDAAYEGIGKLYYLLDDADASVRYYLTALHLQTEEAKLLKKEDRQDGVDIKKIIKDITDNTASGFKNSENASALLLSGTLLIHLGHSLIDRDNSEYPDKKVITAYHDLIKGVKVEIDDNYREIEKKFYHSIGFLFAMSILHFSYKKEDAVLKYFLLPSYTIGETLLQVLSLYKKIQSKSVL